MLVKAGARLLSKLILGNRQTDIATSFAALVGAGGEGVS